MEPYKCEQCNYATFVKKNLLWHNSLCKKRNIKPTALSILEEIKKLSTEEREKLLKYISDSYFSTPI
jgi:hypothetical protein